MSPDQEIWTLSEIDYLRRHIKQHYISEQAYECCYCRQAILSNHGRLWDIEHVMPQSAYRKFTFEPQNLAIACVGCNDAKSNESTTSREHARLPKRSEHYRIVHPHFDSYGDHIEINLDLSFKPKTPKGAFTIWACNLTRYKGLNQKQRRKISDKRFDKEIDELRFATTEDEALPLMAAILTRIKLHSARNSKGGVIAV